MEDLSRSELLAAVEELAEFYLSAPHSYGRPLLPLKLSVPSPVRIVAPLARPAAWTLKTLGLAVVAALHKRPELTVRELCAVLTPHPAVRTMGHAIGRLLRAGEIDAAIIGGTQFYSLPVPAALRLVTPA